MDSGKATRGIGEKQRTWLAGEAEAWQAQGLVSREQAVGILALYGTSEERAERRRSRGLLVLMGTAAFLVGLGVLLLIGYNWEAMPKGGKLVLIFGCILGVNLLGVRLRFRTGQELGSEVAFFLGGLLYGAGIMLVAQIFHINAHYPDGVWWWALGVIPFALVARTPLLHALVVALLAIWCWLEVIGDPTRAAWLFGRPGFLPNGAYTLPILALPGFLWAYHRHSAVTLSMYVPLLVWWAILQPITWRFELDTVYFIGVVGGGLLFGAGLHAEGNPMAIPYRFFGTLLAAGVLVPMSFHEFARQMERESERKGFVSTLVLAGLILGILLIVVALRRLRADRMAEATGETIKRLWFPGAFIGSMFAIQLWSATQTSHVLTAVLANAVMVVLAFWLIQTGLREDRGRPFAAGVLYFLLWAVLRYVDLFGDMGGILGAAMMFFLCGAALFGVALFWRRRKQGQHV